MITVIVWHVCSLRFTLVSEPAADDDDEDCVEIGYAYVSLVDILHTGRDLVVAEIPSQHHHCLHYTLCLRKDTDADGHNFNIRQLVLIILEEMLLRK